MTQKFREYVPYGWKSAESLEAHTYLLPALKRLLPKGTLTILDVGCGNGYVTSQIASMGHTVVGVDASEDGIAIAKEAYPNARFEVHSAYDDLRNVIEAVDIVISSEVIEHLYRPRLLVDNVFTILRPGGLLFLTTPYHGYLKNLVLSLTNSWDNHFHVDREGGHIKFFSERTLSRMLYDCGFENVTYHNVGRVRWLWKSMVCKAEKPLL
jgi:2-polyprenyl-3-methyl-5-hydroxy-6-metoxy-1,4-benzoquinol methylase